MRPDLETLIHFIGQQAIRGKMTNNTSQSYFSSLNRVFEVADEREKANVLNLDLDHLLTRFRLANERLGANTLASYEGRVRAAIRSFEQSYGAEEGEVAMLGTLTIPLRTGAVKIDGLPSDLTKAEASRIAGVLAAMAI